MNNYPKQISEIDTFRQHLWLATESCNSAVADYSARRSYNNYQAQRR